MPVGHLYIIFGEISIQILCLNMIFFKNQPHIFTTFSKQKTEEILFQIIRIGPGGPVQCKGHWFNPWSGKIPQATEQLSPWATTIQPMCCDC